MFKSNGSGYSISRNLTSRHTAKNTNRHIVCCYSIICNSRRWEASQMAINWGLVELTTLCHTLKYYEVLTMSEEITLYTAMEWSQDILLVKMQDGGKYMVLLPFTDGGKVYQHIHIHAYYFLNGRINHTFLWLLWVREGIKCRGLS